MDNDDLLVLSEALEETKPLVTRVSRSTPLRRTHILLRLAYRAARRHRIARCQYFLDLALPGLCQSNDLVSCASEILGVYNHLSHLPHAA